MTQATKAVLTSAVVVAWLTRNADAQSVPACAFPEGSGTVFYDMHDGDMKSAIIADNVITITPHGNNENWKVSTTLQRTETAACVGVIDFNVPGKPNPPPFNLSIQLFTTWGYNPPPSQPPWVKPVIQFTKAGDTNGPVLNEWVNYPPGHSRGAQVNWRCPTSGTMIVKDMGDGDEKRITIDNGRYKIEPYGNDEKWIVQGHLDPTYCGAMIDFNVPGKPNPPPCTLKGQLWLMNSGNSISKYGLEFTDPTNACKFGEPGSPLNLWVDTLKESQNA